MTLLLTLLVSAATAAPPAPITAAAFAPDGKTVVVGSQAGIQRLRWPELAPIGPLPAAIGHVHDLAFSPDGSLLAAAGGRPAVSGELLLFSWPAAEPGPTHRLADEVFYKAAWRADSRQLALAGGDMLVRQVDRDGQPAQTLAGHSRSVLSASFLGDGGLLVSVGLDQSVRVWDLAQATLVQTYNNHTAAVHDVASRPHDPAQRMTIATAGADGTVRLWWPVAGRLVRFARLEAQPLDIDWTPDGTSILAACNDGHLRVIDPATVQVTLDVAAIDGWAYTVAASPDGRHALVAGSAGQVQRVELGR